MYCHQYGKKEIKKKKHIYVNYASSGHTEILYCNSRVSSENIGNVFIKILFILKLDALLVIITNGSFIVAKRNEIHLF